MFTIDKNKEMKYKEALENIANYILPVYNLETFGKAVEFGTADYLRQIAKEALKENATSH